MLLFCGFLGVFAGGKRGGGGGGGGGYVVAEDTSAPRFPSMRHLDALKSAMKASRM